MSTLPRTLHVVALAGALAGCAAVPPEAARRQTIDVRVEAEHPLPLLDCVASNDRGRWSFAAPGPVVVEVSGQPLRLHCDLPGAAAAEARAAAQDPARTGGRTGAKVGGGLGVAAGAAAAPMFGAGAVVLFALGGVLRGAEIGSLVGAVGGGGPAYPPVIVVKVERAP